MKGLNYFFKIQRDTQILAKMAKLPGNHAHEKVSLICLQMLCDTCIYVVFFNPWPVNDVIKVYDKWWKFSDARFWELEWKYGTINSDWKDAPTAVL